MPPDTLADDISPDDISEIMFAPQIALILFFFFIGTNTDLQLWPKLTKWDLYTSSRTNSDLQNVAKPNRGTLFSL